MIFSCQQIHAKFRNHQSEVFRYFKAILFQFFYLHHFNKSISITFSPPHPHLPHFTSQHPQAALFVIHFIFLLYHVQALYLFIYRRHTSQPQTVLLAKATQITNLVKQQWRRQFKTIHKTPDARFGRSVGLYG